MNYRFKTSLPTLFSFFLAKKYVMIQSQFGLYLILVWCLEQKGTVRKKRLGDAYLVKPKKGLFCIRRKKCLFLGLTTLGKAVYF